ncbi:unnamed protein product [Triticum turgidum subsp. durum]|uniref:Uncharacterized protein n=1 Tax=Triticum turgidum subsp. durum TaxID=4567 RepID=A0A9R0ZPC8_TRITD|nr:unnamed protein product [Triticum turgidum subsp. durum]
MEVMGILNLWLEPSFCVKFTWYSVISIIASSNAQALSIKCTCYFLLYHVILWSLTIRWMKLILFCASWIFSTE